MIIFSKKGKITEQNDKTNIKLDFTVPDGIKRLVVKYSYYPKEVDDKAKADSAIAKGMKKYGVNFADSGAFMPVKNLVTLSFDEEGEYRGACHRQPNEQTVVISDKNSTPGIFNRPVKSGKWDVVLNIHFAGCDIDYSIEIDGEGDE